MGFKYTFADHEGVIHIVAMPKSTTPFTACARYQIRPKDVLALRIALRTVTCLACWAREALEPQIQHGRNRYELTRSR